MHALEAGRLALHAHSQTFWLVRTHALKLFIAAACTFVLPCSLCAQPAKQETPPANSPAKSPANSPANSPTPEPITEPTPTVGRDGEGDFYGQTDLARNASEAFDARDFPKAERLLIKLVVTQKDNFVPMYNLACAQSLQGKRDEAAASLVKAVERGFSDIRYLQGDASLAAIKEHPTYQRLIATWPDILLKRREADIAFNSQLFASGYINTLVPELRIVIRSAFPQAATDRAIDQLKGVAKWAQANAIADVLDAKALESDPWVVVVLPSRPDFLRWLRVVYGPDAASGNSMIGGAYQHDLRRLVSIDLASTLRHEFMHVVHWRSMSRMNQRHPIWIMEGFCSLPEDCIVAADGSLTPTTSWRTNTVKRMDRVNGMLPLRTLATLPQIKFMSSRPLANYAQSRAFFLFLSECGKLKPWYEAYIASYAEDPTGLNAIETVFKAPLADIEIDFRLWVRALEPVPDELKEGMPSLGAVIDAGIGEGPIVRSQRRIPGVKGSDGLRMGDVIIAIENRPTREMAELVRVLTQLAIGDEVDVAYRRGRITGIARIELIAHREQRE